MGLGGEGGSCVRSMVQRLVVGDLVPVRIVAPLREMSMVFLGWNVAVQPWLQSRPMDRREPEERAGKMWATHAAAGRCGRSRGRCGWKLWWCCREGGRRCQVRQFGD